MRTGWKWFWRATGMVLFAVIAFGIYGVMRAREMGFLRSPVFETERPTIPRLQHPAVLVFSKTNSFIHKEAIPAAKELIQALGPEQGFQVYATDNGAVHNKEDLARFDVIVWNNVTGDVLLPAQRTAMRNWIEAGGGYVGLHSAGDDSHSVWPWYQNSVIRAVFIGHPLNPQFQQADVLIEQPTDPIVEPLGQVWNHFDEWYSFESSPRAQDLRVLATLDEASYSPGNAYRSSRSLAMGDDHPVLWKHCVGEGRVFYSAAGHTAESYATPQYRAVLARAISWAGRMGAGSQGAIEGKLSCEAP